MWNFASSCIAGRVGCEEESCSGEGMECPICWESFNMVENVPYVLWCGHTLCKNCILGLRWAVLKFPSLPVQLPLFISCPWCALLSFRLVYRGSLRFPRKNYFLLWMVETMNGNRVEDNHGSGPTTCSPETSGRNRAELARSEERGPPQNERLQFSIESMNGDRATTWSPKIASAGPSSGECSLRRGNCTELARREERGPPQFSIKSSNRDRVENRGSGPTTCSPETTAAGPSSGECSLRRGELARPEERGPPRYEYLLGFERLHIFMKRSLFLFVHMTAKFPLVLIFLMIVVYAIPASAAVLALYLVVTVLFALPSFLILYFSYPSLDWLVREIVT